MPRSPAPLALPPHRHLTWRDLLLPGGLMVLMAVPTLAAIVRVVTFLRRAPGPEIERYYDAPVSGLLHITAAIVFCVFGAVQVSPALRRRWPRWHMRAGRVLAPLGLLGALTGVWMVMTWPQVDNDGASLLVIRLAVGAGMAVSIVAGMLAIRRRDWPAHGAWMLRAFAIGLGAGTQVFTHIPYFLIDALQNEAGRALAMGGGWALNLAVAEWVIRRRSARSSSVPRARAAQSEVLAASA